MKFTLSVRSAPATPRTSACPPSLPSVPTSRHTGHFRRERPQLIDHRVDRLLQLSRISPRTSTVIFFEKSPLATAVVTSAMLLHLAGRDCWP